MRFSHALMGLAALLALGACTRLGGAEPLQVHLADIRLLPGGLFEQRFQVDLRFGNPNDFDLALDGLTFELELNDVPFARGLSNEAVTVPRLGEARLRVVASTTLIDLVQQVLILGQRDALSYRIEGVVYLRGAGARKLPYETSGRLQLLPAPPN